MSERTRRQLRQQAFEKQNRCCYYCEYAIWESERKSVSTAYGLTCRLSQHLKSAAEHLVARRDRGQDATDNIGAACLWCEAPTSSKCMLEFIHD